MILPTTSEVPQDDSAPLNLDGLLPLPEYNHDLLMKDVDLASIERELMKSGLSLDDEPFQFDPTFLSTAPNFDDATTLIGADHSFQFGPTFVPTAPTFDDTPIGFDGTMANFTISPSSHADGVTAPKSMSVPTLGIPAQGGDFERPSAPPLTTAFPASGNTAKKRKGTVSDENTPDAPPKKARKVRSDAGVPRGGQQAVPAAEGAKKPRKQRSDAGVCRGPRA